ncbi:MAG: PIN domain-containing protein [Ardenticatenaceae bacterium]|nr:PIN domain-containing protein [Ardenticatenaceae bacterium]
MKVLLDTNVILDVVFRREEWLEVSGGVWQAHVDGYLEGFVTATTVTDIFYVVRRYATLEKAREVVTGILHTLAVVAVDQATLFYANQLSGSDFEDNVQMACVVQAGLEAIVTRDKKGFKLATVPVYAPAELLDVLEIRKE